MQELNTEVLVVGGGTGGVAAAIQAARRGAKTILVSQFGWLGGMLTTAGVAAPDGNELVAWQTGLWGAFLRELQQRQPGGLEHSWVSFFTYEPRIGAEIFANWVHCLPNLHWLQGQVPLEVLRQGDRITGVCFADYKILATVTIDATELGDVLALGEIPYRWGWDWQQEWAEPSAPETENELTRHYAVQAPTWVVVLEDFGHNAEAPEILAPPIDQPQQFTNTWSGYGAEQFLNYGRLPGNRFMINWPQQGNDYGVDLDRLVGSPTTRQEFLQAAYWHTQSYARFLQSQLGRRYGLADQTFPRSAHALGGGAFALHPYYRESRRLQGLVTVREQDILPISGGKVAALPSDASGHVESIALGNYANDHHYPGYEFPLAPKSIRWGGRWTGTPFTLPYRCLVPAQVDGVLGCEKNISVSHIANGATRLQPIVLGIGQAAGMAAALCIEQRCQPRDLAVAQLQTALLTDPIAPSALVPLFDLVPNHPNWLEWQRYYLAHPDRYPLEGEVAKALAPAQTLRLSQGGQSQGGQEFTGMIEVCGKQDYKLHVQQPEALRDQQFNLVTLHAEINQQLQTLTNQQQVDVWGILNRSGNWIRVEQIKSLP